MENRELGMVSLNAQCASCGATLREHRLVDRGLIRQRAGVARHHFHQGVAAEAADLVADFELEMESDEGDAFTGDPKEWE